MADARIGQKNRTTRRWERRGRRPSAPHDRRTKSAYIFGAICPKAGKGAGLVMPWCDTRAMTAHLAEISRMVEPGAHAVVILDQAGWPLSKALVVPENGTLLPLPPRSPELNPVENIWQYIRETWLSNRVFGSYEGIVARTCEARNRLRPPVEEHYHRPPPLGPWVPINASWYQSAGTNAGKVQLPSRISARG